NIRRTRIAGCAVTDGLDAWNSRAERMSNGVGLVRGSRLIDIPSARSLYRTTCFGVSTSAVERGYFRCAPLNAACVVPMLGVAVWKVLGVIVWFAKPSFSSRSCEMSVAPSGRLYLLS